MPQKFNRRDEVPNISINDLQIGQLGEIVGDTSYRGMVVTKTSLINSVIVAVCGNSSCKAFMYTWSDSPNLMVRVLEPGESVTLTN